MPEQRNAVVLVVKDEISDILTWLSWYHLIGFDTCIVFDDWSSDGTWEALERASKIQDVRLERTPGDRDAVYQVRQGQAYRDAIEKYRSEFDWIAFFDADEFLALHHDQNIRDFLLRFPNADAIAINWCNYGSSGHVLKPKSPCVLAFTLHGEEIALINRHVKSIVRPTSVGSNWLNVHCYDVPEDRYVLASGEKARWSDIPGIINSDPDWSMARVMHYQCRSMQHFVERAVRRVDLSITTDLWNACDFQSKATIIPPAMEERLKHYLEKFSSSTLVQTAKQPDQPLIMDLGMSEGNDTAYYLKKGFRVVGLEPDVSESRKLWDRFRAELQTGKLVIHSLAASDVSGKLVEFYQHKVHQGLSGLSRRRSEFVEDSYLAYPVMTIDWATLAAAHGIPYYLKIDIEGREIDFLHGMRGSAQLPEYISVECYSLAPVEELLRLGYKKFKLVDQNPRGGFRLPTPQNEGLEVVDVHWQHSSGPFGRDLPDVGWLDYSQFVVVWSTFKQTLATTWYDCHAWMPSRNPDTGPEREAPRM